MTGFGDGLDWTYDSYLTQVPEGLRGQIEPAFKSYSEKLQESVKGQLGDLAPFKEIVDTGWTPEHVNMGLQLLQQLDQNPQQVFQGLIQEYPDLVKTIQQQPQSQQIVPEAPGQVDQNIDPALDGRLKQMEGLLELLAQGYQQQQSTFAEQQNQAREQSELQQFEEELNKIAPEDKYHRPFILSYIAQGQTPQEAIKSYTDWQTSSMQQQRSNGSPLVAPAGGGGLPSEPIDTSKLTDKDRVSLITQYLNAANQQG